MQPDRSAGHSLGPASIKNMLTPYLAIKGTNGNPVRRTGPAGYVSTHRGLGWVLGRTRAGGLRAWHSGSNGSGFRCHGEFDPAQQNGLVIMTGSVNGAPLCRELNRLADYP